MTLREGSKALPSTLRLLSIFSAQRGRGDENAIELRLTEAFREDDSNLDSEKKEEVEEFDEAYWQEFEKDACSLDEKLAQA